MEAKALLRDWERRYPGRVETMFRSLQNVQMSHLMDRGRFDFSAVAAAGTVRPDGDKAFDQLDEFL
jgi:tRNA 2-thiocytidine biosynthesis protein TtcA